MTTLPREAAAAPAGPELNNLIAEHLLGCNRPVMVKQYENKPWVRAWLPNDEAQTQHLLAFNDWLRTDDGQDIDKAFFAKPYSTEMSAAWPLWQHCLKVFGPAVFGACLCDALGIGVCSETSAVQQVAAFLSPLAICRAALLAKAAAATPIQEAAAPALLTSNS